MQILTDPILHDCARIIERHPDLSPTYKARLLQGLVTIDGELQSVVRAEMAGQDTKPKKVAR